MPVENTLTDEFETRAVAIKELSAEPSFKIPPLETGDRLTRYEFERRYEAMPQLKKAELIEGVVYMPSPVRFKSHGQPHSSIVTWLGVYCAATPGVELGDNASVRLDLDNEPQPDALLRIKSEWGGQTQLSEDDYVEGGPELVVEIAGSSAAYDLHDKLKVYCRNGVQEYLVWQIFDKKVNWFRLREGEYIPLPADEAGIIRSEVFPGLHLAVTALLSDNMAQVLAVLQNGLASEAHKNFAERLTKK